MSIGIKQINFGIILIKEFFNIRLLFHTYRYKTNFISWEMAERFKVSL